MSTKPKALCPSAQPDWDGARLFAVVAGTPERPEAAYLDDAPPATPELLALAGPVAPAEVFRFAAPCAGGACAHFDDAGGSCRLAAKTVRFAHGVVELLPRCAIRKDCRWWQQEGAAACRRCPQVVTVNYAPRGELRDAGDPSIR